MDGSTMDLQPAQGPLGGRIGAPAEPEQGLAPPFLVNTWHTVLRRKWLIAAIISAALALALVGTLLQTPRYTATARLEISRAQKQITNVEGVESERTGQDLEFYQTQYSLLEARSLAERVARSSRLENNDDFWAASGVDPDASESLTDPRLSGARSGDRERRLQLAVEVLLENVQVSPIRGSALVDVGYQSTSPQMSATIANAWTREFTRSSIDRRFASTADAMAFLEARLAELRQRLEQSERDLVTYARQRNIVALSSSQGPDGQPRSERTLAAANLEALNASLAQATAARIAAEGQAANPLSNANVISNQALSLLREQRAAAAANLAQLNVQFEPQYPAAQAAAQQVASLDRAIATEERRIGQGAQQTYRAALAAEQLLRTRVDALTGRLDQQRADSIQYNIYQREVDTNRELYDSLLQRYKEIGVASVGASNIAVVDEAQVPTDPTSPSLPLNMLLALVLGTGLAGLVVFVLEQIDEGLRDPSQVGAQLGVPLLGSVPVEDTRDREEVVSLIADSKTKLSEAYFSIQSTLGFATDHGVPRTLMLTSMRPAEGKTTSSIALATMLARTGKSVLLIDSDMRSPSIGKLFEAGEADGLSRALSGDDDWGRFVVRSEALNLAVLPAGRVPPNPAELLTGDRFPALLRSALASYDHVVVDAPPVLGLADAPLLSRMVEAVVFVVESASTPVRGVRAAMARLQAVGANLVGVVLTKVRLTGAGYGYGYGYGYGLEYGEKADQ